MSPFVVDKITLILILHNRHKNLDRLLAYYNDYDFPIIIADSSTEKHVLSKVKNNWFHSYTPGLSFTQKIEIALYKVATPYVAMCADDDFILPESLHQCVLFLEQNKDYSIAQGWAIRYYKESIATGNIRYGLLYDISNSIEGESPLNRLVEMFSNYRSVLYAVFKTDVLQQSFKGGGKAVKNLFLNEYITAFIPIVFGKYKELPILYQVREFAEDSDDKTAIDLDTMLDKADFENELNDFKKFVLNKLTSIIKDDTEKTFNDILHSFSTQLKINRNQKISLKKRVGKLVNLIPVLGKKIISRSREKEAARQLKSIIKTGDEKEEITKISKLLLKFQ